MPPGKPISKDRLNQTAWEVGHKFPAPLSHDHIALYPVHPRLGYLHWYMDEKTKRPEGAWRFIVRVYDVTDIIFNGSNAHSFFDIEARGLSGNYYFGVGMTGRSYLCEAGFMCKDGSFRAVLRSNAVFFDREGPSRNYKTNGLFVGRPDRTFEVENIFDAPAYQRLNQLLSRDCRPLNIAVVYTEIDAGGNGPSSLGEFIEKSTSSSCIFGVEATVFPIKIKWENGKGLLKRLESLSEKAFKEIVKEGPFDLMHCHDWAASLIGLKANERLDLPLVHTLYSTELERVGGAIDGLSGAILEIEKRASLAAFSIIVPCQSTADIVVNSFGVSPQKVVVVPYAISGEGRSPFVNPSEVKRWYGLNPEGPLALFAGELSHHSGADLFVDALPTVCRNHKTAQFLVVGDGDLRGELEGRIWRAGTGGRCRFTGGLPEDAFEKVLMASDFVVIPSRGRQDEGLALRAISSGRPVVTTHQAGLGCVVHGRNGLVTFDNPGSIVWGIQEMLSNPLHGSMLQLVARKKAGEALSPEGAAARHYIIYREVLND